MKFPGPTRHSRRSFRHSAMIAAQATGRALGAAGEHAAELRWAPVVVPLPVEWAPRREALFADAGQAVRSRQAYGLTYASCQASGSPLIASIAADVGASVPRVRGAMRRLGFLGGRPRTGGPVTYGQVGRASGR